jgi:hypothetical protein
VERVRFARLLSGYHRYLIRDKKLLNAEVVKGSQSSQRRSPGCLRIIFALPYAAAGEDVASVFVVAGLSEMGRRTRMMVPLLLEFTSSVPPN